MELLKSFNGAYLFFSFPNSKYEDSKKSVSLKNLNPLGRLGTTLTQGSSHTHWGWVFLDSTPGIYHPSTRDYPNKKIKSKLGNPILSLFRTNIRTTR